MTCMTSCTASSVLFRPPSCKFPKIHLDAAAIGCLSIEFRACVLNAVFAVGAAPSHCCSAASSDKSIKQADVILRNSNHSDAFYNTAMQALILLPKLTLESKCKIAISPAAFLLIKPGFGSIQAKSQLSSTSAILRPLAGLRVARLDVAG